MKLSSRRGKYERESRAAKRRLLPIALIPIFLVLMVISAIELLRPQMEKSDFEALAAIVRSAEIVNDASTASTETMKDVFPRGTVNEIDAETNSLPLETGPIMLAKYESIFEQNNDFFGWLQIEGTAVDYPVMHTPDDPEFYLRNNFAGDYSVSGVPFMASECYEGCGNYIIYGHNMKNGSMFNSILSYRDEKYWKEHPTICFDTLYQSGEYEIYAAFYSKVYNIDEADVFRVYDYVDLSKEQIFNDFTQQAKAAAIYETNATASFGDEFITLITCSYHENNGRFVVIAKRI